MNAVCLLSGGLDSSASLAWAKQEGFACYALSFDYGQRHRVELAAAGRIAQSIGVERHITVPIDLRLFGGSALTSDIAVPRAGMGGAIPVTYVPARNTIFLSLALAWAEVLGASNIVIGVNAVDYSGYPDCRPEFISAFETMANLATRAGAEGTTRIKVHTPLLTLTKGDIVKLAAKLKVELALTHSCYDPAPDGRSCGTCDSCALRLRGFEEAGLADPLRYVSL